MSAASPYTKLLRPDDPRVLKAREIKEKTGKVGFGPSFAEDKVDQLYRARQSYKQFTGNDDLKDVTTTGAYKKFTSAQKIEYRKRYPKDFLNNISDASLSKRTLLGG